MLNTGLLLSKPGESGYAIYRRMLVANLTTSNVTRAMNSEFDNFNFKPSKELGTGEISHRLASLARQKEKRYLKEHTLEKIKFRNKDLHNKYRPQKQCPYCAEIAYHSMLFDLPWIEVCPIHKTKLLRCCPGCRKRWPCASEIINNPCSICGRDLKIKKLIKMYSSFFEQKSQFNLMEYMEQLLIRKHYKCATRYKNKTNYLTFYAPKLEYVNVFQASVILNRFKSQKVIGHLINLLDLPTYEVATKTYKLKPNIEPQGNQTRIEGPNIKLTKLVKKKLYNALLQSYLSKHEPGTCICPETACTPCATWNFWRAIVDKEFNIKSYSSVMWLKFIDNFYGRYIPTAPWLYTHLYEYNEYGRSSFQNIIGRHTVPKRLQSLVYYIDLWTLAICIFHDHMSHSKQNFKNQASIQGKVDKTMTSFMVADNYKFCPILMERINESEIKIFFPKDLLFTQLPMPKYIKNLAS